MLILLAALLLAPLAALHAAEYSAENNTLAHPQGKAQVKQMLDCIDQMYNRDRNDFNARLAKKNASYNQALNLFQKSLNFLNQGNLAEATKTVNELCDLLGMDFATLKERFPIVSETGAASADRSQPPIGDRYYGDTKIGEVTCLIDHNRNGSKKPVLILCHGLGGSRRDNSVLMKEYSSIGYFCVSIDSRMHGGRALREELDRTIKKNGATDYYQVRRLIKETADDIPGIIDALSKDPDADISRVCIMGGSMGGYVAIRAAMIEKRIKAAVSLIASPIWSDLPMKQPYAGISATSEEFNTFCKRFSPEHFPDQFVHCALLMQIGGADVHYDPENVKAFCEKLRRYSPDKNRYDVYVAPGSGHAVTPDMWKNMRDWFKKQIGK